ncbi:MAG: M23 family metallopeptidase [Anaerolineae bacterium]
MRAKIFLTLFIIISTAIFFLGASPTAAFDDHWNDDCEVSAEAEKNVILDEYGERVYYNVDQKVFWELASDFCVSFELMVAYNFALFPRKPDQYTYIKIPPGRDEIGWIPGKSLNRPENVPDHLAAEFYFEETPIDQFSWPIRPGEGIVSQLYHHMHYGIDISVKTGTSVHSIANGRVIRVHEDHKIYGKVVIIDHGNDIMAIYGHFSEISVKVNDFVSIDQQIGLSGNTGLSSAPHLHFEFRESFQVTNPCDYYDECPPSAFHGPPSHSFDDPVASND